MRRPLLLLVALGLLAGKALAQEREWSLDASDQEAYLIFGVPDTDDVGVSLWCPVRKGVVNLLMPRPTAELKKFGHRKVPLTLHVGKETATFAGKIDLNTEADASSVEVEMPATQPLLAALLQADRFSVTVDHHEVIFPLYDANVQGLLDLCRKG